MHTILQDEELICKNNRANTRTHIPRHTPSTLALRYTRVFSACTHTHTHACIHTGDIHKYMNKICKNLYVSAYITYMCTHRYIFV